VSGRVFADGEPVANDIAIASPSSLANSTGKGEGKDGNVQRKCQVDHAKRPLRTLDGQKGVNGTHEREAPRLKVAPAKPDDVTFRESLSFFAVELLVRQHGLDPRLAGGGIIAKDLFRAFDSTKNRPGG
jgi:hypothetical protein